MFLHFLVQNFHERGVHEFAVIGNEKADARFGRERPEKFLRPPLFVPLLHDHADLRPAGLSGS